MCTAVHVPPDGAACRSHSLLFHPPLLCGMYPFPPHSLYTVPSCRCPPYRRPCFFLLATPPGALIGSQTLHSCWTRASSMQVSGSTRVRVFEARRLFAALWGVCYRCFARATKGILLHGRRGSSECLACLVVFPRLQKGSLTPYRLFLSFFLSRVVRGSLGCLTSRAPKTERDRRGGC